MRCEGIQINAKIPVEANQADKRYAVFPLFRDGNDVIYEIEAIKNACKDTKDIPIIRYKEDGSSEAIGVAHSVSWNPTGFIEVDGVLWFGGTSEDVVFDSCHNVVSMNIEAIGLGCN